MVMISLIAAVDENLGLGNNNQLLCHLPADLQYFKKLTMGKPIIMGRKTYISIGRPLPGRTNIILSHTLSPANGIIVVNSLVQAIRHCQEAEEIFIIGGAEIFNQAITLANRLYITRIHHQFGADVFFPKMDEGQWHCVNEEFREKDDKNEYDMTFFIYEKIKSL